MRPHSEAGSRRAAWEVGKIRGCLLEGRQVGFQKLFIFGRRLAEFTARSFLMIGIACLLHRVHSSFTFFTYSIPFTRSAHALHCHLTSVEGRSFSSLHHPSGWLV